MDLLLPLLLAAVVIAGASIGVVVAVRSGDRERTRGASDGHDGLVRLTAEVHTGWEQTLLGLIRELGLPRGADELRYGQLYVETRSEQRLLIRSRSEIGRGFVGAVDLEPRRGFTQVTYAVVQQPGDEALRSLVLGFEPRLVAALHRIDQDVEVRSADPGAR